MRRPATLILALTLVLAACGDDAASTTTVTAATTTTAAATTTVTPTTEPPTTTAPTTTTLPPTTTTTAPLYLVDPTDFFPDVFGAPGDPHGSGCVVGADVLPAGVWFGYVDAVGSGVLTFDLACFFTGADGVAAATADGEVGYDLDFYIRNQNPKTYSVTIAPAAQVWYVDGITVEPQAIAPGDWPTPLSYTPCPGDHCSVWLYVNGGVATGIVEQYLP
ncbi:MAG TPA: hypothetical protein VFY15_02765 [Acidimicrobiia bacterium]|nr:hypothetical protein [Acidimicrobiia bacterium]